MNGRSGGLASNRSSPESGSRRPTCNTPRGGIDFLSSMSRFFNQALCRGNRLGSLASGDWAQFVISFEDDFMRYRSSRRDLTGALWLGSASVTLALLLA